MNATGESGPLPICIVHWNRPSECLRTLDAFRAQDFPVRLTVVDNGSSEDAVRLIESGAPDAEVIRLKTNIGFGPAANVGLKHILTNQAGDLIVVAPHDALPQAGCLRRLVEEMARHPAGGMASADYGIPQRQRFNWLRGIYLEDCPGLLVGWQSALYPHGTLMIFRRRCLDAVGLFDERFFAYTEEQDLGLRARKAGWEVGVVSDAVVQNPIRAASGAVTHYLNLRNSLLLVYKQGGWLAASVRTVTMLANCFRLLLRPGRRIEGHSTRVRLRAILDFWRGRFGSPQNLPGSECDAG